MLSIKIFLTDILSIISLRVVKFETFDGEALAIEKIIILGIFLMGQKIWKKLHKKYKIKNEEIF